MIIIVGAGIAGMYMGYLLKGEAIILEESNRIGGRAGADYFEGAKIPIGAGIGRHRDKHLKQLMRELGMKVEERLFQVEYGKGLELPMMKIYKYLKEEWDNTEETFKEYGIRKLGVELYEYFTSITGYTDYENEAAYNTFHHYGMEDNTSLMGFSVDWNELVVKLASHNKIYTNTKVTKIIKKDGKWHVNDFICDKVIVAVPINKLKEIIEIDVPLKSQPFLRIYASVREDNWLSAHTILDSPLHRIIPMGENVHMVAYTDNKDAVKVNKMTKRELEKELERAHKKTTIIKYKKYFWKEGTHYWTKPMREKDVVKIQLGDIYLIGEGFSLNQGWVEGALESVRKVHSHIINNPSK